MSTIRRQHILAAIFIACGLVAHGVASAQGPRRGAGGRADTAQAATVIGTVVDATTREPLAAATASLWTARDSTLVTGAIAERDGRFALRGIRPGRYYLLVSFVGYRHHFVDDVTLTPGATFDAGQVAMAVDPGQLGEITVTGERGFMSVEIDRNVYRTDDMPVAAGGSATDVLRNIPSVEVDVDGNISMRGNQNIAVQINGRPVLMSGEALANYLQTLPAESIERVEIIANPSARYDPEGMGGILNLELKKGEERGLSGGVNAGAGTVDAFSVGGNVGYGSGPWNLSANYGLNARTREMLGYRLQESRSAEPAIRQIASDTGSRGSLGHSLNATIEYALTPEHTLSLSSRLGLRVGDGDRATTTIVTDAAGVPVLHEVRSTSDDDDGTNMDHRLGYRWTIERRVHELSAELRYDYDRDVEHSLASATELGGVAIPNQHQAAARQKVDLEERGSDMDAKLDYVRPLWLDAKLETGAAMTVRSLDNQYTSMSSDSTGELIDDGRSNSFDFTERLNSVYAILGQSFGSVDLQLGMRAELASTTFDLLSSEESYDSEYVSLFPSALVGYRPSDETQLRLSYSKRITRPRTRLLNPFSSSTDPRFRHVGNPYLRPEYTHSIELSISQFLAWGTLQLTPYGRRTTDAIQRYERVDSAGVVTATFENLGQVDSWGAELLATARAADWLSTVAGVSAYRSITDASNIGVGAETEALVWTARLTATANVGWGTTIQGTLFYRSPSNIVGGHTDAHVMSDIALTKTLLDDRLRIGARVNDPFDQSGMRGWRETDGYRIETERRWGGRTAMLTVSYVFGKPQRESTRREREGGEDIEEIDW